MRWSPSFGLLGGPARLSEGRGPPLISSSTRTYTCDAEGDGHILTAMEPLLVARDRYDPFGRRYAKTVNGVTTVYDDGPEGWVIAVYNGSGHVLRLYGYLGAAAVPVTVTPAGAMRRSR